MEWRSKRKPCANAYRPSAAERPSQHYSSWVADRSECKTARRKDAHPKPVTPLELEEFQNSYTWLLQRLDKVASKHTIHKNTAARKRSRLARRLNAARAAGKGAKAA